MLYQVDALDPATFAAVAVIVFIVATAAAINSRAPGDEYRPMTALRHESDSDS